MRGRRGMDLAWRLEAGKGGVLMAMSASRGRARQGADPFHRDLAVRTVRRGQGRGGNEGRGFPIQQSQDASASFGGRRGQPAEVAHALEAAG